MPEAPLLELANDPLRRARIAEGRSPYTDERGTRKNVLQRVRPVRYSADAEHRQRYGLSHLPRCQHADRQNRRAAYASRPVSKNRPAALDVDEEARNGVDDADRVGPGVGCNPRRVTNVRKRRRE